MTFSLPDQNKPSTSGLVNYSNTSDSSESSESDKTPMKRKRLSRKRTINTANWKKNKRKVAFQKGEQHINYKGVLVPGKRIITEKDCLPSCRFKCSEKFDLNCRKQIKDSYYSMNQNEKYHFLLYNTKRIPVKRKKSMDSEYRIFSFEYSFENCNQKNRVCKRFFLNTLHISQKPIYNVHKNKTESGTPKQSERGKGTKDRISKSHKDEIRKHIEQFPVVESHYCRADSNKKYLDPSMNIQKMYDLYVQHCEQQGKTPQKNSLYRYIFNYEYNLDFLKPKNDRCDTCEEYKQAKKDNRTDDIMEQNYKAHIAKKNVMRQEREKDKTCSTNPNLAIISFDLENVINIPKSDVSVLFYKQKLNVYNLTAHNSLDKQAYCAIWPETMCGRSGNDIASAFIAILEKILIKHPNITDIITWSDSCVPQNRNSIISLAVTDFLLQHNNILSFTMKYSLPGHSCIQVVDNIHSQIEKQIRISDVWSPLSLMRILLKTNRRNPFHVINLQQTHFKNFQQSVKDQETR